MRKGWRIVKPHLVDKAFTGEGARIYSGRWNSKGSSVVYISESLSLASMELLVHLESQEILNTYICIAVEFDNRMVQALDPASLPDNWNTNPVPLSTKLIGDTWIKSGSSLILKVPSVIIPAESNFIVNPAHPDLKKITIGPPQPLDFDPRIIRAYI
jgi:RES domain-containing protein